MTGKADKELVDYRMEKSRESIAAAKVMVKEKMFAFAVNRIYYSRCFTQSRHCWVKGQYLFRSMVR